MRLIGSLNLLILVKIKYVFEHVQVCVFVRLGDDTQHHLLTDFLQTIKCILGKESIGANPS